MPVSRTWRPLGRADGRPRAGGTSPFGKGMPDSDRRHARPPRHVVLLLAHGCVRARRRTRTSRGATVLRAGVRLHQRRSGHHLDGLFGLVMGGTWTGHGSLPLAVLAQSRSVGAQRRATRAGRRGEPSSSRRRGHRLRHRFRYPVDSTVSPNFAVHCPTTLPGEGQAVRRRRAVRDGHGRRIGPPRVRRSPAPPGGASLVQRQEVGCMPRSSTANLQSQSRSHKVNLVPVSSWTRPSPPTRAPHKCSRRRPAAGAPCAATRAETQSPRLIYVFRARDLCAT